MYIVAGRSLYRGKMLVEASAIGSSINSAGFRNPVPVTRRRWRQPLKNWANK